MAEGIAQINNSFPLTIAQGGTGATTAAAARNNLGLGNTTGALPTANGGTGNSTGMAASVVDNGNKSNAITLQYSGSGVSSATWFAVWDNYSIKAMTAANMRTNLGGICARPNYSISTTDLTDGSSSLASGQIYFVY